MATPQDVSKMWRREAGPDAIDEQEMVFDLSFHPSLNLMASALVNGRVRVYECTATPPRNARFLAGTRRRIVNAKHVCWRVADHPCLQTPVLGRQQRTPDQYQATQRSGSCRELFSRWHM